MKHWEEYFYNADKSYTEEELVQIRKLLRESRTLTCIFVPIVSMLVMGCITLCILSIILDSKALDTSTLWLFVTFCITCAIWGFFRYRNSQKRIALMKSFGTKYKKPC